MAEACLRFTRGEELSRRFDHEYDRAPPDIWTACSWAAQVLEAEWGRGPGTRYGEAEHHFFLHVRQGRIVLTCRTNKALFWTRISGIARDTAPTAYGFPIEVKNGEDNGRG